MLRAMYGSAIDTAARAGSAFLSGLGRFATLVSAGAAGWGLFDDMPTVPALVATVVAGLGGAFLSPSFITAHPLKRPIGTAIYLVPHATLSALLASELVWTSTEARLYEGAALLAWTAGVWWLRPARLGKNAVKWGFPGQDPAFGEQEAAEAEEEPAAEVEVVEPVPADRTAAWWHLNAAQKGGVAEGTMILGVQDIDDGRRAVAIGAKTPGEPVPKIDVRRLSALWNLPPAYLDVQDVPGYGAGVAMILIGPQPEAAVETDVDVWKVIGQTALPGVVLMEVNEYDLTKELS